MFGEDKNINYKFIKNKLQKTNLKLKKHYTKNILGYKKLELEGFWNSSNYDFFTWEIAGTKTVIDLGLVI